MVCKNPVLNGSKSFREPRVSDFQLNNCGGSWLFVFPHVPRWPHGPAQEADRKALRGHGGGGPYLPEGPELAPSAAGDPDQHQAGVCGVPSRRLGLRVDISHGLGILDTFLGWQSWVLVLVGSWVYCLALKTRAMGA